MPSIVKNLLAALVAVVVVVTAAASQDRSLTDQRGRVFSFATPAARVVTIAIPLFWTFITVDGSAARVVGTNPVAAAQMKFGILDRVFPGAGATSTDTVRGGTFTPNVEALLALKPDAVFQWADRGDQLMAVLDRVGLRTIGVKNTGNETDIERWMEMSGVVSGRSERGARLIAWMRAANRHFEQLSASIPAPQRPKVLMLSEYSRAITPNGPHSYVEPMIRRTGGINAATSEGQVNIETVLAWNPDIILLSQFEAKTPTDLIADPLWRTTSAARSRRVYKLPFGITRWGGYGPESPFFLTWLAELTHPGRFGLSLRREMADGYRVHYNYRVTEADLDQVLLLTENGASAHYARFRRVAQ